MHSKANRYRRIDKFYYYIPTLIAKFYQCTVKLIDIENRSILLIHTNANIYGSIYVFYQYTLKLIEYSSIDQL